MHAKPRLLARASGAHVPHVHDCNYTHAAPNAGMGAPEHKLNGASHEQGVERVNLHSLRT